MNHDALLIDLRRVRLEMRGISPKVSTYQKLLAREQEIMKRLGGDPAAFEMPRRSFIDRAPSGKNHPLPPIDHKDRMCAHPGCKRLGKPNRKTAGGLRKRKRFCSSHLGAQI